MLNSLQSTKCAAPQLGWPVDERANTSVVFAQTSRDRVDLMERLAISTFRGGDFEITHIARKTEGHGMTDRAPKRDSYVACVHFERLEAYDIWCDDELESAGALEAGAMHVNDMRQAWRADIRSPFDVVNFGFSQSVLDEVTSEEGGVQIKELHCPMRLARVDGVLRNVALALLPALARPHQTNRLFTDHAARAVIAHLAKTCAPNHCRPKYDYGGLAPWQERRANEMLRANLSGDLSLPQLANACRLSVGHFSRAFKQTMGCPPHQWLLHQRIERAKQLILNTDEPLCAIALDTGFADQSHFTRVFSRRVGASPAAWRRDQAG
jgi:AraC family transcriptional regulator